VEEELVSGGGACEWRRRQLVEDEAGGKIGCFYQKKIKFSIIGQYQIFGRIFV
jgi:hypothetical protein